MREYPGSLLLSQYKAEPSAEAAVREVYDEIPGFFQEDYPKALYGQGTVASCGSSMTALAMTATYLTGYTYLPDELARNFAGKAGADVERIEYAAKALGLVYETVNNWDAMQAGKCASVQLNDESLFAEESHFVVLKGVTEDGKVLVQDPCGANYTKEALLEGFASGFEASVISQAFGQGWIFERTAIPGDIKRYEEPVSEEAGERYASLELSTVEKQLLARAVCVLGKGECAEGQQAVAEALLNRLLSEEFSGDLKALIYGEGAPCDVAHLNEAEATEIEYGAVERALYGPYLLNENVTDFSYKCHE